MKPSCCTLRSSSNIIVMSPVSFLWTLLSIIVSGLSFFTFLQPFWLIEPRRPHCLGVFSYCVKFDDINYYHYNSDTKHVNTNNVDKQLCGIYGGFFSFDNLPSGAWKATCILFGGGCLVHSVCALCAFFALFFRRKLNKKLARATGFSQGLAVLLCIGGLLTFPVGFGSPLAHYFCSYGDSYSGIYKTGVCELGWSYLLAVMATALSLFCPVLAYLYDIQMCLSQANAELIYPDTERSIDQITHSLSQSDDDCYTASNHRTTSRNSEQTSIIHGLTYI